MKIVATFNDAEDTQLESIINTFKARGANVRIGQLNEDGTVDLILIVTGCQLEGGKGIELQGKLFETSKQILEKAALETSETPAEVVEGEIVE